MNTLSDITRLLEEADFQPRPSPIHVAELALSFARVLEGPREHHELALVIDVETTSFSILQRHLRALTLALDRTGSVRPVTVILVESDQPIPRSNFEKLLELCRMIRIPVGSDTEQLKSRLRPILPLELPQPTKPLEEVDQRLEEAIEKLPDQREVQKLLRSASSGPKAVERAFLRWFESNIEQGLEGVSDETRSRRAET